MKQKWTKELKQKLVNSITDSDILRNFPEISLESARRMARQFVGEGYKPVKKKNIKEEVKSDVAHIKHKEEVAELESKYEKSINEINRLQKEVDAAVQIKQTVQSFKIEPALKDGESESTAMIVISDTHCEELVSAKTVNGLNEYNPEIFKQRMTKLFQNAVKLLRINGKETNIKTVIVAILGDMISGNIHECLLENTAMRPMDAILLAQDVLVGGINYLLENTPYNYKIVCHSGNHSRITKKINHATENGNSLEYMMYHNIRAIFKGNDRVDFLISEGYHSYVELYGKTIRFSHGTNIKWSSGVGGVFVPIKRSIMQWSQTKHADLDVFGHLHTFLDGGNFLSNGSVIGFSTFSLAIKASYEPPQQTFCMFHKKHWKSVVAPIWLS